MGILNSKAIDTNKNLNIKIGKYDEINTTDKISTGDLCFAKYSDAETCSLFIQTEQEINNQNKSTPIFVMPKPGALNVPLTGSGNNKAPEYSNTISVNSISFDVGDSNEKTVTLKSGTSNENQSSCLIIPNISQQAYCIWGTGSSPKSIGSENKPVYIDSNGEALEITSIATDYGGTGLTSGLIQNNRLSFFTNGDKAMSFSKHYVNTDKLYINYSNTAQSLDAKFLVNGDSQFCGNLETSSETTDQIKLCSNNDCTFLISDKLKFEQGEIIINSCMYGTEHPKDRTDLKPKEGQIYFKIVELED